MKSDHIQGRKNGKKKEKEKMSTVKFFETYGSTYQDRFGEEYLLFLSNFVL